MFVLIFCFCFVDFWVSIQGSTQEAIIRRDLNFTQLVSYDGYESETHHVTTSDGYILTIFHVLPNAACSEIVGDPVVLMHGLYLSGDDWIVPGPGRAHAYLYAEQCRDVWVFNARGNVYSRAHETLDPDTDPQYWDFTWDDMALYDLPPCIDYVLDKTGKSKVAYVSHSQGATCLMYLCAKVPEYNDKISVGFGLSMTAFLDNARFIVVKAQGLLSPLLTAATEAGANAEIVPRGAAYQPLLKALCGTTDASYLPCSALYFTVLGYDNYQLTKDVLKVMMGHIPSGTSVKNFNRWGQIQKHGFRELDRGAASNLAAYNESSPPEIDVSRVSMRWIFVGSDNDYVSDNKDVARLVSLLQNATQCVLADKLFGHLDYMFGKSVPTVIVPMISKYLDTGVFTCL